jgi:hypothetical protein
MIHLKSNIWVDDLGASARVCHVSNWNECSKGVLFWSRVLHLKRELYWKEVQLANSKENTVQANNRRIEFSSHNSFWYNLDLETRDRIYRVYPCRNNPLVQLSRFLEHLLSDGANGKVGRNSKWMQSYIKRYPAILLFLEPQNKSPNNKSG